MLHIVVIIIHRRIVCITIYCSVPCTGIFRQSKIICNTSCVGNTQLFKFGIIREEGVELILIVQVRMLDQNTRKTILLGIPVDTEVIHRRAVFILVFRRISDM